MHRCVRVVLTTLTVASLTITTALNAQVDLTQFIGLPERAHLLPVRFGYVTSTLIYDSMFWNKWPLTGGAEMLYPTEAGWNVGGGDSDQVGGATGSWLSTVPCSQIDGGLTGFIYLYTYYDTTDPHNTTRHFSFAPTSTPSIADAQCTYVNSGLFYPHDNDATILGYPQNGTVYADDGSITSTQLISFLHQRAKNPNHVLECLRVLRRRSIGHSAA